MPGLLPGAVLGLVPGVMPGLLPGVMLGLLPGVTRLGELPVGGVKLDVVVRGTPASSGAYA